jgi:hypothetical protein
MEWVAALVLFTGLCVLLNLLLPSPPPSRWRRRMELRTARVRGRFHRRVVPDPDPFDTLRLQTRLGHLAGQIRLMALEAAYDDLLDEACRLAGVPQLDLQPREERRWREEQELASRGWSW